jgi:MoaA/NifB/PqqE/SkfB family radical SAM enzyme
MITRRCNYRCRGCDVWRDQKTTELSTEEIKKGLDILRELGIVEIVLSGGNPLIRDDIGEIIDYSSKFFVTTVYDNGSLAMKKIDKLHNADFVAISVDSLKPEKNDYIKGVKGAWKDSMKTIEELRKAGINVSVSPTISQFNLDEILNLTHHFIEKEIPIWYCLYSYDFASYQNPLFTIGKKNEEFTIVGKKAMVNLCDSLIALKKKHSNILMTNKVLNAVKNLYLQNERTWSCRALQDFIVVDHQGRVSGCHLHDPVASIFDLPKIWKSSRLDKLRDTYRRCDRCTYMCYIFYSIHGGVAGNLEIARERWRNARILLKEPSVPCT